MRYTLLVAALLASACGGSSPNAPTTPQAPAVPACQSANTATVTMTNASPNNFTFDILIDNITRGTVTPGQSAPPMTVTAGVNHTFTSRVTNTNVIGCTSTTSFAQCTNQSLTCRY
jgi:hypothetical protein